MKFTQQEEAFLKLHAGRYKQGGSRNVVENWSKALLNSLERKEIIVKVNKKFYLSDKGIRMMEKHEGKSQ